MRLARLTRNVDGHKGDFGRVLAIAGSRGMTGAAFLAGHAAMRSGAGLVTIGCPASQQPIMAAKCDVEMTLSLPETGDGALSAKAHDGILAAAKNADAVLIGPGMARHDDTARLTLGLIEALDLPLVLDADALYHVKDSLASLKKRTAPTVLTPHMGEAARLVDTSGSRTQTARLLALLVPCGVAVLKGAGTIVCGVDGEYVNATGNPGMATGGAGDVLAGMIAAFLARGLGAFDAACLAVHLHGLAGDIAAETVGQESLLATDIIEHLPSAFRLHAERF